MLRENLSKKNIFWPEMWGCGEKENIILGLLIILYFVFLFFCPNPQSFDMRDKKKMLDSAFQLATSGLDPNCHSWICFSFYETTRNFFGASFAGSN